MVEFHAVGHWLIAPPTYGRLTPDTFTAAFVPAELVDDIAAARAACLHPVANEPRLRAAVAAYDAHIGETT